MSQTQVLNMLFRLKRQEPWKLELIQSTHFIETE